MCNHGKQSFPAPSIAVIIPAGPLTEKPQKIRFSKRELKRIERLAARA